LHREKIQTPAKKSPARFLHLALFFVQALQGLLLSFKKDDAKPFL